MVAEEQKQRWIAAGGDPDRAMVIPVPVEVPHETKNDSSYRAELGLENKFVFGMHQRNDKNIFSPIPLRGI